MVYYSYLWQYSETKGTVNRMKTYNLSTTRELLWDMELADKVENVSLQMHKPIRKNIALTCDSPWEGEHCAYGSLIYDGEKYRL